MGASIPKLRAVTSSGESTGVITEAEEDNQGNDDQSRVWFDWIWPATTTFTMADQE